MCCHLGIYRKQSLDAVLVSVFLYGALGYALALQLYDHFLSETK